MLFEAAAKMRGVMKKMLDLKYIFQGVIEVDLKCTFFSFRVEDILMKKEI